MEKATEGATSSAIAHHFEHGYIDLSLPALVRAGRAARAVPTSAAERVANLKSPGPSTARRDAIQQPG